MREVDATVGAGGTGEEGGLELALVHPDGDVGLAEVLEAAGVVEVEMADDDLGNVFRSSAGFWQWLRRASCSLVNLERAKMSFRALPIPTLQRSSVRGGDG